MLIFYRLYLHPLAEYPGPLLARITSLHAAYHAWVGDSHLVLYHAHRKHGKFVRFTPNFVSVNDAVALNDIYGHGRNVQKSTFYSVMPPYPHAFDTHTVIDRNLHGRKRRVMSQAFSEAAIRGMEENVLTHIRTFVKRLGSYSCGKKSDDSQPRNMAHWSNWLTFDVIGDLCFGKTFGMLTREEWRDWPTLIDMAIHRHAIAGISLKIHKLGLGKYLFPKIAEGQKTFVKYSREQAKERIALGAGSRKDFFHYLLDAKDPQSGEGYSMSELWSESNLLIAAGSHTPSTALVASFFFLANYPKVLAELTILVRKSFQDLEEIRGDNFNNPKCQAAYKFVKACLDEAMRMAPPVPTTLPRQVLKGGITVAGRYFPEGVDIATPSFTLHMNETYYSDPFTYNPHRFLADKAESPEAYQKALSAFAPFSLGPRSCIGRTLAYLELTIALARTVWMYDFDYAGGGRETRLDNLKFVEELGGGKRPIMYSIDDHHTAFASREGPNIRFIPRLDLQQR
ncbi:benzoate 4-monooxygenase cytochrome P450 [Kalaharituber pfeilii]|nr:benzoate 4-monooxygenase cytochrome P450 [Kalaharituber pfeilii]